MEKSTISALILAGATVVGGVFQALVLRAARKKREAEGKDYRARTGLADPDGGSSVPTVGARDVDAGSKGRDADR